MSKWYVGQDRVFTFTLENNLTLTDPTTIAFQYKEGKLGAWTSVTPVKISTGKYTATVNPQYGGGIFWQWKTTTPNFAREGMDYCQPSQFATNFPPYGNYDYGFGLWR